MQLYKIIKEDNLESFKKYIKNNNNKSIRKLLESNIINDNILNSFNALEFIFLYGNNKIIDYILKNNLIKDTIKDAILLHFYTKNKNVNLQNFKKMLKIYKKPNVIYNLWYGTDMTYNSDLLNKIVYTSFKYDKSILEYILKNRSDIKNIIDKNFYKIGTNNITIINFILSNLKKNNNINDQDIDDIIDKIFKYIIYGQNIDKLLDIIKYYSNKEKLIKTYILKKISLLKLNDINNIESLDNFLNDIKEEISNEVYKEFKNILIIVNLEKFLDNDETNCIKYLNSLNNKDLDIIDNYIEKNKEVINNIELLNKIKEKLPILYNISSFNKIIINNVIEGTNISDLIKYNYYFNLLTDNSEYFLNYISSSLAIRAKLKIKDVIIINDIISKNVNKYINDDRYKKYLFQLYRSIKTYIKYDIEKVKDKKTIKNNINLLRESCKKVYDSNTIKLYNIKSSERLHFFNLLIKYNIYIPFFNIDKDFKNIKLPKDTKEIFLTIVYINSLKTLNSINKDSEQDKFCLLQKIKKYNNDINQFSKNIIPLAKKVLDYENNLISFSNDILKLNKSDLIKISKYTVLTNNIDMFKIIVDNIDIEKVTDRKGISIKENINMLNSSILQKLEEINGHNNQGISI